MASQYTVQLLALGRSLVSWSNRFVKFLRHRMLTQKKNMLIIGDEDSPIYMKLYPQLANSWEIVHIAEGQQPEDTPLSPPDPTPASDAKDVKAEEKKVMVPTANVFFNRVYLHNQNYDQIQRSLQGKQFDSIVVLPKQDHKSTLLEIDDDNFCTSYPTAHEEMLMRSVFAYRLASKCLTSSGVLIFSISQHDFIKEYQQNNQTSQNNPHKQWFSNELVDAQVNYLGVVVGDRDYTDLNSWSIVALTKEIGEEQPDFVAKYYKLWADSQQLPMPGTFALFKPKTNDSKSHFVQYL